MSPTPRSSDLIVLERSWTIRFLKGLQLILLYSQTRGMRKFHWSLCQAKHPNMWGSTSNKTQRQGWAMLFWVTILLGVYFDISLNVHLSLLLFSWCCMFTRAHSDCMKFPSIYLSAGMWPSQAELGVINNRLRPKLCINRRSVFALNECPLYTLPSWISGQNIKNSRMWDFSHHPSVSFFENLTNILYYFPTECCPISFSKIHHSQGLPFHFQNSQIMQCSPLLLSPNLPLLRVQLWILDLPTECTEWVPLCVITTHQNWDTVIRSLLNFP